MPFHFYVLQKSDSLLQGLVGRQNWKLFFTGICTLTIFLFSFPNYHLLIEKSDNLQNRIRFINQQITTPLDASIFKDLYVGSHESKRAYRLLIPSAAHILGLNYYSVLMLESLLGFAFLYLLLLFFHTTTQDKLLSCYLLLGISSIYIGKSSFYDIGAYYDFFAFFLMLLTVQSRNPAWMLVCVFAGGFVDERFLLSLPSVWLCQYYLDKDQGMQRKLSVLAAFIIAIALIFMTRMLLSHFYGLHIPLQTGGNVGLEVIKDNFHFIPIGILTGLEFFWFLIACAAFELFMKKEKWIFFCFLFFLLIGTASAFLVYDITRSISYLFPLLLLTVLILSQKDTLPKYANSIKICCLGCFVFASIYVEGPNNADWISPIFPKILKLLSF